MKMYPISDFAAANEKIKAILAQEKLQAGLKYPALAFLHPQATDRAIVFLHGFTNSPHQFSVLGRCFYDWVITSGYRANPSTAWKIERAPRCVLSISTSIWLSAARREISAAK